MSNKVKYSNTQMEHCRYTEIQIIMYHKVIQVILNWLGTNTLMEK